MSCEAKYEYGQRDDCRSEWDSANEVINCRLVFANYFSQDECAHARGQKKKPQRSKRRLDVATQIHDRDRRKQRNQPNSPFSEGRGRGENRENCAANSPSTATHPVPSTIKRVRNASDE